MIIMFDNTIRGSFFSKPLYDLTIEIFCQKVANKKGIYFFANGFTCRLTIVPAL